MATMFRGLHLTDASFSFDIRVTAADNVTSNLYRFVYGKRHSRYHYYAAGSSFDMKRNAPPSTKTHISKHIRSGTCSRCPTGMFSVGVDALQCSICRPGHYTNRIGSAKCHPCPQGTFTYTWGSDMCRYWTPLDKKISSWLCLIRPCLFGSAAVGEGSEYCELCPEGYITQSEGSAHCTVLIESTDLRRYYAVIVSFGVVLNGTTLEEIDQLGRSKSQTYPLNAHVLWQLCMHLGSLF